MNATRLEFKGQQQQVLGCEDNYLPFYLCQSELRNRQSLTFIAQVLRSTSPPRHPWPC